MYEPSLEPRPGLSPARLAAAAIAATGVVLFVVVAAELALGLTWAWDTALALPLYDVREPALSIVGRALAVAGSPAVGAALAVVVAWRVRKGWPASARALLLACAADAVVSLGVKEWVARPRPALVPPVEAEMGYSFPSGHALASVAIWGAVLAFAALHGRHGRAWTVAAVLFAVVMGLSRVYLGVHWPSDVVAGWGLGVVILSWAVAEMADERRTRPGAPSGGPESSSPTTASTSTRAPA